MAEGERRSFCLICDCNGGECRVEGGDEADEVDADSGGVVEGDRGEE